jgi:hypothetical protein
MVLPPGFEPGYRLYKRRVLTFGRQEHVGSHEIRIPRDFCLSSICIRTVERLSTLVIFGK